MTLWGVIKGLLVQEESDRTKQLSVEVDPTATTNTRTTVKSVQTADRTLNLPDVSGELVEKDAVQTITNKNLENPNNTLTTASSDSFTRQTGNQQLVTIPDTTGADTLVSEAHSQTLTNKTIDGDDNTLQDISITSLKIELADAGKFIERDGSGAVVSGKDVPGGDVVGTTDTQTLTNKTIDGTSATGTNTVTADMSNMTYDNSTSGMAATNGQTAVDEVEGRVDTVETNKLDGPGTHADNLLLKSDGVDTNDMQTTGISVDDLDNVTGVNDLTVGGNLTVNGTTTTLNTATLDVEDTNITVNKNGTDPSSEGAGITVERAGTDGSLIYEDALASKFKLGALGSEVEIADVSTAQTITNKNMASSTNNMSTASADSLTRLTGNQQLVTIPDTATPDNFVLEAQSQVITNKDIDGGTASDTSRVTLPKADSATLDTLTDKEGSVAYDTDLDTVVYNDGTQWNRLAGGESGINYVPNSDGETGVTGYNAYDDTNSVPTDGTGGSPSSIVATPVILAADVVRGQKSIGIVKSAADAQGEGISIDLDPIDNVDKNQKLTVSFDYKVIGVTPENYNNGDMRVYVYDVDNAALLTDNINGEDGDIIYNDQGTSFVGEFLATDSANYRLIFHVRTTNALSYALSIDTVKVSPVDKALFSNLSDWVTYPITVNGLGSGTHTTDALYRRVGDSIEIQFATAFTGNGSGASGVEWTLPSGLTIDASKLNTSTTESNGRGLMFNLASFVGFGEIGLVPFAASNSIRTVAPGTGSFMVGSDVSAGEQLSGTITIPIEGWTSSNVVSNNEINQQTLVTTAPLQTATGTILGSFTNPVIFTTLSNNDANAYNTITGQYIAPRNGKIAVSVQLEILYTAAASITSGVEVRNVTTPAIACRGIDVDNSVTNAAYPSCEGIIDVKKGDVVEIRAFCNGTSPTYGTGFTANHFSFHYIPDYSTFGVSNPNTDVISITAAPFAVLPASAGFADITSFDLPPGEWDVDIYPVHRTLGTAPGLAIDITTMIGTVAGNNSTGLLYGDTGCLTITDGTRIWENLPTRIRKNITVNATTTYYLKYGLSSAPAANSMRLDHYQIIATRIK